MRMSTKEIITETVNQTLTGLGLDLKEINEMQADFIYLRKSRKNNEDIWQKIKAAIITVCVPSFVYSLYRSFIIK
jgi:hypothetical protein